MEVCKEPSRISIPFHLPANILMAGETNSGKSCWIEKLLEHKDVMLSPSPEKVLLLYRKIQPLYEEWARKYPFLEMAEGINKEMIELQKDSQGNGALLILDDLMLESMTDPYIQAVYTTGRHFKILGVLSVWHNVFPKGKNSRLISLNCTGYILMHIDWNDKSGALYAYVEFLKSLRIHNKAIEIDPTLEKYSQGPLTLFGWDLSKDLSDASATEPCGTVSLETQFAPRASDEGLVGVVLALFFGSMHIDKFGNVEVFDDFQK